MDASQGDFWERYKAISSKLKKRFLRKPNVSEASTEFVALAKELENQECSHYAAFCLLAVARCEHTLGNPINESQALIQSARLFLETEELNHRLLCPGFSENLNAAISSYQHAIKIYLEKNQLALATTLYLEIGQALQHLSQFAQAVCYYKKAAELQCQVPLDYLNTLKLMYQCQIEINDFDSALTNLTEVCNIADEKCNSDGNVRGGVFASILAEAEISSVLLLLMLEPVPQKMKKEHAKLLERYAWDASDHDRPSVSYMERETFLLLQSFVMASQDRDIESLKAIEDDLWQYISAQQKDLVRMIVKKAKEE